MLYRITTLKVQQEQHLAALRKRLMHQVIDITRFPLFDIQVTLVGGERGAVVHMSFDLTFIDAGSVSLVFGELGSLYTDGTGNGLLPLRVSSD